MNRFGRKYFGITDNTGEWLQNREWVSNMFKKDLCVGVFRHLWFCRICFRRISYFLRSENNSSLFTSEWKSVNIWVILGAILATHWSRCVRVVVRDLTDITLLSLPWRLSALNAKHFYTAAFEKWRFSDFCGSSLWFMSNGFVIGD